MNLGSATKTFLDAMEGPRKSWRLIDPTGKEWRFWPTGVVPRGDVIEAGGTPIAFIGQYLDVTGTVTP